MKTKIYLVLAARALTGAAAKVLTVTLAGAAILSGCQQDVSQERGFAGWPIAVSGQTGAGAGESTRTTLNGFHTDWVQGDKIGVFSTQAGAANLALIAASAGSTSAFEPVDGAFTWGTGAHDFYAYYPHAANATHHKSVPISLPANQTQSAGGNSDHLAALDFMVARPLTGITPGEAVQFRFDHVFTLLEFRVVGEGKLEKIELKVPERYALSISDGWGDISISEPNVLFPYGAHSSSVTLTLAEPAILTTDKTTTPALYMMVLPTDISRGMIEVMMTIDGKTSALTANGFNLARGQKYNLVIDSDKGIYPDIDVLDMIPDPAFRAYCESMMSEWDTDQDGKLSYMEAASVKTIFVEGDVEYDANGMLVNKGEIASLEGIEYFTGLRDLNCQYNKLTTLDISKNLTLRALYCDNNNLRELDVSRNTSLANLICSRNKLSRLDVSKNKELIFLMCGSNSLFTLDISNNTKLIHLECSDNNLSRLDVSKNTELTSLSCVSNKIASLDLSANTALTNLQCNYNPISELNLSNNTSLVDLGCAGNKLTTLDISKNTLLTVLVCWDNPSDGISKFPVKVWFSGQNPPFRMDYPTWNANGKTITIAYTTGDLPNIPDSGYYTSTDYSADGRVRQLQTATKGAGIDIVLMGDGYSDRLIADGTYDRTMQRAMEYFFLEEPYKSLREMFNVWVVDVVSKNEVYAYNSATALECILSSTDAYVFGQDRRCQNYAHRAISNDKLDNATLAVIINNTSNHGTCHFYFPQTVSDYGEGLSISYFTVGTTEDSFRQVLHHEVNGHGFAKLLDEYGTESGETISSATADYYKQHFSFGYGKNVDLTNNPLQVKWAKYLTDSRYVDQKMGVYEGGLGIPYGVWRSTENSIMRYNTGGFNAPSREAIWYRIHKLAYGAGWQYNHEEFIAWDLAHYYSAAAVSARATAARTAGIGILKPVPHTPPVVIPHSWREEMKK